MRCKLSCLLFLVLSVVSVRAQISISASSEGEMRLLSGQDMSLVAKVNSDFVPADIEHIGGVIGSRVGDVITIRMPHSRLAGVRLIDGIDYLQVAHKVVPSLKKAIPDMRADSVYAGYLLDQGYTGKDVIIGITDWGFDYTHPMFYDTALQHTRILAAWDQFKTSGPAPDGYDYGTMYEGEAALLAAEKDTSNIYEYATHGSHVAGICGGSGAGTQHRGVAYEANYLMVTFLVDEAAIIDAFSWMKEKADEYNKRLVVNMSWGLYNLGPLDGTSLVSQVIDQLSAEGVIFVTSGGNNGDVKFHIKKTFENDTMHTRVEFYGYGTNPAMWGQSISAWGEQGKPFEIGFSVYDNSKTRLVTVPLFKTEGSRYIDSFVVTGTDTVFYNAAIEQAHPLNSKPTIRLRIKNTNTQLRIGLTAFAESGDIHFYNVTELTTDVGNWGMPFSTFLPDWVEGDNKYSMGEPASTRSVITVAAHQSEIFTNSGIMGGGFIAPFSSHGPTIDDRMKPDVSAPGVNVASSVSSFTTRNYTLLENVSFNGKTYPFSRFSGTSMSSPAVTGVVALMLQANPNLYADEAKVILHSTAREDKRTGSLPAEGSTLWGRGKVNASAAVRAAERKFLGIRILDNDRSVNLYPNPTKGVLYSKNPSSLRVQIYSLEGKLIQRGILGAGHTIDVSSMSSGIYLIRYSKTGEVQKFVVD